MSARLAAIIGVSALAGASFGAQQLVPTKTLLVKNPPSGSRKVLLKVKDTAATVVGDPTGDGAVLRIVLTPGGDQCVTMPASGWSAIGTIGFKYKDATLANGPVKVALVKKTPSGTFLLKTLLKNGGPTPITVAPGGPTATYATNFTLGTGDEYCGGTATVTPKPNDAVTFKVSNDGVPAGCAASCSAATTSTSVTTTFTGTITTTSTTLPAKVVFVTSVTGSGNISSWLDSGGAAGLMGADSVCQARALFAGLSGTYKAWLSNLATNAASRLTHSTVPYVLPGPGGAQVADDWADLTDGSLDAPINVTESGTVVAGQVWTGTDETGSSSGSRCSEWTIGSAVSSGTCGSTASTTTSWTTFFVDSCGAFKRLYCLEQ